MIISYRNIFIFISLLFFIGCSTIEPVTVAQKYDRAMQHIDKQNYSLAVPILESIIKENQGTRFAAFAYLKMGDIFLEMGGRKLNKSEENYRIFLNYSSYSHLVPYVLSQLIELNYKKNVSMFFSEEYAYYRDPEHFKKIIYDYQRFFMLYPESLYLADAKIYLKKANTALAEHEFKIGQWYMEHELYVPAIARFRYTLNLFPLYRERESVVNDLIFSYRKNQQPELAEELTAVFEKTFK